MRENKIGSAARKSIRHYARESDTTPFTASLHSYTLTTSPTSAEKNQQYNIL